ncbi:B-box zinc finger protein 20-like [Momordica charantia]|uniref:B-box zinc finger protein 20-like n=1 Tax=Momordica charantia TaxID=3673 RepID=A0A6J1CZ53_MOMCH|nr:B-box zinc finger protein 20-like [Momordica charantia]
MKIRCDVCDIEEASVFCPSDEAALCAACDRQVHRANKLAGKHSRFSLIPFADAAELPPPCDICQLRRAVLFCKEDRAILCSECDIPIHEANEHTRNHGRFLLTGVKILPATASSTGAGRVEGAAIDAEKIGFSRASRKRAKIGSNGLLRDPLMEEFQPSIGNLEFEESGISDGVSFSKSSISEYLESLPGWCVEEFLDS